jgi:3-phenylpropionate/trans-cinnamate dioxygenase ferredoxin subunit
MSWTEVCPLSDLPPGSREVVEIDDVFIAVFNVAGQLYAIENICTHDGAPLTGGCVENDVIICPRHGARFSLETGAALTPPAYEAVDTFPVEVREGIIYTRDDRWD